MLFSQISAPLRVLFASIVLASFAVAQNDTCATAIAIGNGLTAGNNLTATTGPDPIGSCTSVGNDVWYSYLAPCTGVAIADLCGPGSASYDTVLAAFSGVCGSLTEIACDDDNCFPQSQISFPVSAGTIYYVSVAGFGGAIGTFNLSMNCIVGATNDACSGALVITEAVPVGGTNIGASTGPEPTGSCGGMATDVWYVFTPVCSGTHTVSTCNVGTNYDSVVAVWDGSLGCGSLTQLACNDDNCGLPNQFLSSTTTWSAVAGSTYYISVGGFFGGTGTFTLSVNNGGGLSLAFTTAGLGSIGYQVTGAPPLGNQFTAISLVAGNYPNGWFYGLDIAFSDLVNEINTGFPFLTPVGPCGDVMIGPVSGAPSGLTLYGVSLAFPPGSPNWSAVSPPATGTVP